ncbi:nuclear transport factor 2 family protein [Cellulosimicrobium sp. Marseille-Q8652]
MVDATGPGGTPLDRHEEENATVVRRLVECINARDVNVMDELFHDDAVMDWPQSGEKVVGAENRRGVYGAFPQLPTISPWRVLVSGDLAVLMARLDYDGPVFETVFVFELRDGRIAHETAQWAEPFEPQPWRSEWVTVG